MKILALADRAPQESILSVIEKQQIELVLTLGDLAYADIRELARVDLPKLGVYGNHCSGTYMEELGITNMHRRTLEVGGLLFGGFEGCVRYKESQYAKMYTQEEATHLLQDFPRVDVMLTHCPPYGINDDPSEISHTGFQALRSYVETQRPRYLLHGHTYPTEQTIITHYQETEILYVFRERIIELSV